MMSWIVTFLNKINVTGCDSLVDVTLSFGWTTYIWVFFCLCLNVSFFPLIAYVLSILFCTLTNSLRNNDKECYCLSWRIFLLHFWMFSKHYDDQVLMVMNKILRWFHSMKLSSTGLSIVQICYWYELIERKQWMVHEIEHFT